MKLDNFLQKLISWLFAGLLFLVPLFFTSVNSELFEFNKIILVYAFTTLIVGTWTCRMILYRKILFKRTFFDIPLLLFLASQILSTIFSIDRHTSLFGYYSRFNGGLLSTMCYLLLYWAFVSNCEAKDVFKIIKVSLVSAVIVSIYGIFEHFGHSFSCLMFLGKFDVSCWVQKVQERVFATLGQPNWLAAYLAVLIPITWWLALSSKLKFKVKSFWPFLIFGLFFSCLLFTQSRSGFLGFLLSFAVFWGVTLFQNRSQSKIIIKSFLIVNCTLLIINFIFGSPFPQINKYFYYKSFASRVFTHNPPSQPDLLCRKTGPQSTTQNSPLPITSTDDGGISASSDIRKIVWKGAFDIFKHYPIFGSGVETFAYSYYNFRPMEHNLVSEWDFLYNKAHNEYLNFLSTTGVFGLGSYFLFIFLFVFTYLKSISNFKFLSSNQTSNLKNQNELGQLDIRLISHSLFAGWLSLLVTNFFGFSVVITSLYFFLIPAFITTLNFPPLTSQPRPTSHFSPSLLLPIPLFFTFYILHFTFRLWRSDLFYSQGLKQSKKGQYYEAYQNFYEAIKISPNEPVFLNEISASGASLAYAISKDDATASSQLAEMAIDYSDKARKISPHNLNILKNRVKVFYTLSSINPDYLNEAVAAVGEAMKLAPTDPKLVYNLGLLYGKDRQTELAIETVEKAVEMKPNYVDARNALALFYEDLGQKEKAIEQLEILIKLAPENGPEFQKKIDKLKGK